MLHNLARYACRFGDKNPAVFWICTILGAAIGALFFGVGVIPGMFVGVIVGGILANKYPKN